MKRASVAIAVVLAALAAAPSAFGHATLQQSTPGNNSIVRQSPSEVTLQFSEAVETAFGSIRVYDCGGKRVDSGKIVRPSNSSVSVMLDRRLPAGTYTVTWRVISADAHPVAGAFTFHVKSASAGGECAQVFGQGTSGSIDALFKFMRALDFALILLVVGGAAALALVLRSAAFELRARLYRILAGLALGLVVAGSLCIVLQGAVAGGFGLQEAFRWDTVDSVLQTRFGKAFLWQLGLAVVIAPTAFLASRSRSSTVGWLVLVPALLLLPTIAAAGHARTSGAIALVADVVHVAAASLWVGGLAFTVLALLLAGADRWPLAARAVPVFSILAVASVVTLIAAGTLRGYQEVRAFHGLWDTTYGVLLLVKIGVVLPILALGAYNNRFAVPRLKRQIASAVEQRRFLRVAGAELAIMAVIVGITAVLVTEPPAKASVKATEVHHRHRPDREPRGELHRSSPRRRARTSSTSTSSRRAGVPANVDDAKLSATLPSQGLGPDSHPAAEDRAQPLHDAGRSVPPAGRVAGDDRSEARRVRGTDPNRHRPHQRGLK